MIAPLPVFLTSPRRPLSAKRRGFKSGLARMVSGGVVTLSLGAGCEQKPAVSLHQGTVSNADLDPAAEDPGKIEELSSRPGEWFEDSRGVQVIRARQRGDSAAATSVLREMLSSPELSAHDRAGALVLLGREAMAAGRYEEASTSFQGAAASEELKAVRSSLILWQADAALRGAQPEKARAVLAEVAEVGLTPPQASERSLLWMRAMQRAGTEVSGGGFP